MYQESSLIITKFNIPTISSKVVKRTKLLKKLDTFSEYRLILITAPAGYGKTTLSTSWLAKKQKSREVITWMSLDEEDNDPENFWSYFLLSVYKKISDENSMEENIKNLYGNVSKFSKLHLSNFISIVAKLNQELLMLIDDFNVISNYKIIENMKFLIKNMPSNMHILILSRRLPELSLARLRAADSLLEIKLVFHKKKPYLPRCRYL